MSYDQSTIIRAIAQEEAVAVFAQVKHLSVLPPDPDTDRHLANGDTILIIISCHPCEGRNPRQETGLLGDVDTRLRGHDNVAGYVLLNFNPAYAPFKHMNIPEIQDLNVHPDCRRQGLGERLVRACEDEARAQGCDMIGLGVGLSAAYGAAQRLYCRLGYLPDGAGLIYDGERVPVGAAKPNDDDLCLMMIKELP